MMMLVHGNSRLSTTEAKERRRLQTRLAQRRYRGKKRSEAQSREATISSRGRDQLAGSETSSASSEITQEKYTDSFAGEDNVYNDVMQYLLTSPDFNHLTSPSSSATDSSSLSSDRTPALLSDSIESAIIIAAERHGYVGMALSKHNKMNLRDFLSGDLSGQISNQMLRQGERVFLPKLDFYRAFFANAFALSFVPSDLEKCRMQSRISDIWSTRSPLLIVPDNMVPVEEQFTIEHNIFVDVLPWPSVRRKALIAIQAGLLDMDTFKKDAFFGCNEDTNYQSAFHVHGASADDDYFFNSTGAADLTMDPESWQCSQTWLEKYWFLVDGNIVRRTNWWRRMQGLSPIKVPTFSEQRYPSRLVEISAASL